MDTTTSSTTENEPFRGLIDIGVRSLFAEVAGNGFPTVVLETGRGGSSDTWDPIWTELTALTRVVRYDRAGLGQSDPVDRSRTCTDLVTDLHHLLQIITPSGPYLLVGHSIGGLTIRLYAQQYREDVIGMVFIDPTHHDSYARERSVLPPENPSDSITLREMRTRVNQPQVPSGEDLIDTQACQEQARHCESLGDVPVIVVTGMRRRSFADVPEEIIAKFYELKWALHQEFVRLSSQGLLLRAEHSGHDIPTDEPAKILEAVRMLVDTVRARMQ